MNITPEPTHSSLAQRIARVRNCMLVEVLTGISVTDKDLFLSLYQTYEQQHVVTSGLPSESHESLPHCISSTSNATKEATQSAWPISILGRRQRVVSFLVPNRAGFGRSNDGEDDDFYDWDKQAR